MWKYAAGKILRNKLTFIGIVAAITAFMVYETCQIELSYDFARVLPDDDPAYVEYMSFKKKFGEDGNVMVIGLSSPNLFGAQLFNDWSRLNREIKSIRCETCGKSRASPIRRAINAVRVGAASARSAASSGSPASSRSTLRRMVRDSIAALIGQLMHGTPGHLAPALRRVLAIGSTSGADIVAGVRCGLELNISHEGRRSCPSR